MKQGMGSLIGIVFVTLGALIATIAVGNTPKLGLDLEGGVEVVLRPAEDVDNLVLAADPVNLQRAAEIIRLRVDSIGVAEPDVTVQDSDIVVQLPGVDDPQRAVDLVGQTAELRFRPVLYPPINLNQLPQASALYQSRFGSLGDIEAQLAETIQLNLASGDGEVSTGTSVDDDGEDETGMGSLAPGTESAAAFQADDADGADDADELTEEQTEELLAQLEALQGDTGTSPFQQQRGTSIYNADGSINVIKVEGINGGAGTDELFSGDFSDTRAEDIEEASVVMTDGRQVYLLGPTIFTGAALEGAQPIGLGGGWRISVTFKDGAAGADLLNVAADMCFFQRDTCPTGSMATVLDRRVDSAVGFQTPVFEDSTISISRGNIGFPEAEARDTATVLDFGALPVEFQDPTEAGLVRTVSSTLGEGSLRAGLIAGAVGIALVALYMLWFYRFLGLAAILSLLVSASLLYVIVSFLSATRGLALTLAGIVGLIVSIGVSLDSNVVYFEHLKEDIADGKTIRSSTDRAFPIAFQTVFWANMATLIGAVILWAMTDGSVKGFALMLGIASVLDLVATYFFMRPFVSWLAHRDGADDKPRRFGAGLVREAVEA